MILPVLPYVYCFKVKVEGYAMWVNRNVPMVGDPKYVLFLPL